MEIYQYATSEAKPEPAANRLGFGHLAFEVAGVGRLTFTYVQDPEGNLVELQNWS